VTKNYDYNRYITRAMENLICLLCNMKRYIRSIYYWTILVTIRDFGIYQETINNHLEQQVVESWKRIQNRRKITEDLRAKLVRNRRNRKNYAASRIQNAWKHVISNPDYQICKNRLRREFEVLVS